MDRSLREAFFKLFNREYFNYSELKSGLKNNLYQLYLMNTSWAEKLDLFDKIGDDDIIERINNGINYALSHRDSNDYIYLGASLAIGVSAVLDDILVDYFNEALQDWNEMNRFDEYTNYPTERDLNISSDNRERLYGGF